MAGEGVSPGVWLPFLINGDPRRDPRQGSGAGADEVFHLLSHAWNTEIL